MNKENHAWIKRIARRHVDGANSLHRQGNLRWCVCGHPLCWHKGECGSKVADGIGGLQPCDCPTFVDDEYRGRSAGKLGLTGEGL